jgi:hypothetical protein
VLPSFRLQLLAAAPTDAHPVPIIELPSPDSNRAIALRTDDSDIGDVQRLLHVDDPRLACIPPRLHMPLCNIYFRNDDAVILHVDLADLPALSSFPAG